MTTSRVTVSVDATGERARVEAFRRGIETAVADVIAERERQEVRWGEQNHPIIETRDDIPASFRALIAKDRHGVMDASLAKRRCDALAQQGRVTFMDIFVEEVAELVEAAAIHGDASDEARAEAVQVAAVALAIVERIDRARAAKGGA